MLRNHITHEAFVIPPIHGHDRRVRNARVASQGRFDLSQLDTIATDFDLMIL